MKKEIDKTADSLIFEGMTSISALVNSILSGTNTRRIKTVYYDKANEKSKAKELSFLRAKQAEGLFDLKSVDCEYINELALGTTHGGIIAECTERSFETLDASKLIDNGFYVYLDGIEDPYNFGYTVRSVYASGADGIILSPRNWMSAAGVVARSSAGTSELIDVFIAEPETAGEIFHSAGYKIASAGIRDSVEMCEADLKKPILLVIGGEKRGISRKMLDISDVIVRIDYGRKFNGSLSAAAASAVLSFEVLRQNKK